MFRIFCACIAVALFSAGAFAQLPPDAVMLDKVKVSEKQKSHDLDPVTLAVADPALGTFEYNGVIYGMSDAGTKAKFDSDADGYADKHDRARWEYNFTNSMSEIWCPVTDEISPGGNTKWTMLDLSWESCCQFCNDTKTDEDFPRALSRLKVRAGKSYDLIGGANYTEGASSPVEGAINLGGPPPAIEEPVKMAKLPDWLGDVSGDATWANPIGKIVEKRCAECHKDMSLGGFAPMALTTVGQLRQWKKNLKTHITQGTMPPWPADTKYSYANGKNLTAAEKDLFVQWIDAGFPVGDGEYKITPSKWDIGEPDHIVKLPEQTLAEDVGEHVAQYELEPGVAQDKWVIATQIKPDAFLTLEVNGGPLGQFHMGNGVVRLPEGYGFRLKQGEKVNVSVYYLKEAGWEEYPMETEFGLKFAEDPSSITKEVLIDRMANDNFSIPAGSDSTKASASFIFPADGTIVSVNPVVRYRGKSVSYTVKTPDGKEQEIVSIPRFDGMWHFSYQMEEPLDAPKGTVVTVTATYDNSEMNAQNPDSSIDVKAGPGGELLEGWLLYALDAPVKSAENRFNLTDEELMAATGTCAKCAAALEASGDVATD